jgi:hypothetical protein
MRLPAWVPIALVSLLAAVTAATLLFTTFMLYDDEGYVLYSLQTFVQEGGLYDRVFSQYGPFFYLFNQALHLVGWEFTNSGGRLMALVCWLTAAGTGGAIVWRLTRSAAATTFAIGGTCLHLWTMTSEPAHPGNFVVFVVALAAWLGVRWSDRPRRVAIVAGAAGAALCLTKVNVGVFLFAGAGAWWALHLDNRRLPARWRIAAMGVAIVLLPLALMAGKIALDWVKVFALVAAASGLATTLAAGRRAPALTRWSDFGTAALVGVVVGGLTCAGVLLQGTSVQGLLDGVVLGPLHHPQAYLVFIRWRPAVVPLALVSVALAFWLTARPTAMAGRIVALGRLAALALFLGSWAFDWSLNTHAFVMSYGLVAIWLFVYSLDGEEASQPVRAWLGLLTVTQALHAFPVGGSQISWGTFLWVPLAVSGAPGAWRTILPQAPAALLRGGAVALMLLTFWRVGHFAQIGLTRLRDGDWIGLPGTAGMRMPASLSTSLRILARNANAHADVLFTAPGVNSFHLWTDVPPPTLLNTTHWFNLLTTEQQARIQRRLEALPKSCLIFQHDIYAHLISNGVLTETPLTRWLKETYEPVFALESYQFWVRRGRTIAALGTVTAREATVGATPRYQFVLTLAETSLPDVASIEFARFSGDVTTRETTWTNATAGMFVTPISSDGRAAGPPRQVTFPFTAAGLIHLELRTDTLPPGLQQPGGVFFLRNAAGEQLAEARLVK